MTNSTTTNTGPFPLAGITVCELGDDISASMCSKMLAALGAEVVRIEPPEGFASRLEPSFDDDDSGVLFTFLNTGKRIVSATDDAAFEAVDLSDIVILFGLDDDYPAIDIDELSSHGVIVVCISDFGESGPDARLHNSELVAQATSGLMYLVGRPGLPPLQLGGHQAAYSTGLQAFSAIMIALHHRDRTHQGQVIRISYLESMASLEWKGPIYFQADGTVLRRGQSTGPVVLPTRDGHIAFFYRDTDWTSVIDLFDDERLRDERFADMQGRVAHQDEVVAILSEHATTWLKEDLYYAAQAHSIPVGVVEEVTDLLESSQYAAQDFFWPIEGADGTRGLQPALPFQFGNRRFSVSGTPSQRATAPMSGGAQ